jgi:hypothetical protein
LLKASTKYWPLSTIWRFLSQLVLLLLNTDRLQQFEDFRSKTSSDKNLQIVEGDQYLIEEQSLTKISKLLKAASIW